MYMLVGVLVEVMTVISATEKEGMTVSLGESEDAAWCVSPAGVGVGCLDMMGRLKAFRCLSCFRCILLRHSLLSSYDFFVYYEW